nr:O-antigen ligase family protein [Nitrospirota bacterium]
MADTAAVSQGKPVTNPLPNLDLILRGLLYIYIFSLPFKRLLFIERNGFIILIVLLVLWCAVNRRHFFLRTPIDLPLIAFVGWVGFTVPFATFPAYSFQEFAKLLQQGLMFYAVVYFFREPIHKQRMVWMLLGTLALISAYGIWQFDMRPWMGRDAQGGREYYLIESFLSGDVALTTYLVMLAPLGAAAALSWSGEWKRFLAGGTAALAVLCQFLTFSRAGLLAMLGEAIVFVWVTGQKKVVCWAGALVLTVVVGVAGLLIVNKLAPETLPFIPGAAKFTGFNLEARFEIWAFGLTKLLEHPLTGIGYGKDNFYIVTQGESKNLEVTGTPVMPAGTHNTFLDIAVGSGIPALLGFVWLLGAIVRAGLNQLRRLPGPIENALTLTVITVVAGMALRNFFDHMWVGNLAVQFWVLVGLALRPYESR